MSVTLPNNSDAAKMKATVQSALDTLTEMLLLLKSSAKGSSRAPAQTIAINAAARRKKTPDNVGRAAPAE